MCITPLLVLCQLTKKGNFFDYFFLGAVPIPNIEYSGQVPTRPVIKKMSPIINTRYTQPALNDLLK